MKKYLSFLILGVYASVAFAAVTSEQRIKTDKVVVGRPAPATDPAIEFQGTTQRIKANRTTGRMQFTNDGTNFKNIGSGSGGAGGVNLLVDDNGDFEAGDTAWTESGGTFSIETTNPLFGVGSGKWDSSASAQTLVSNLKTIEKGMVGRTCLAEMVYKWPSGVAADLSFQVLDGSSNVIFSNDLNPTTGDNVIKTQRNFDCGVLGSQYRIRILSNVSNPAEIIIDNAFIGSDANSANISQSTLVGVAYFATTTSCNWTRTNTALGSFGTVAECPGPTVELNTIGQIQTTDTDLPKVTVNNLPPGTYRVTVQAGPMNNSLTNSTCLALSDGTDIKGRGCQSNVSGQAANHASVEATFVYTSSGNRTFELFGSSTAGTIQINNNTAEIRTVFNIYRYPTSPAEAITLETSAWYTEVNIGGANASLGLATVSTAQEITSSSLDLVVAPGSQSAQIPCSSTNPSTGLTCSAGNESLGVVVNIPYSGLYEVCGSFTHYAGEANTGTAGAVFSTFEWVETPNNAQTVLQRGRRKVGSGSDPSSAAATVHLAYNPVNVCGYFILGVGQKTLRLFYEQSVSGTATVSDLRIDRDPAGFGDRDMHITVRPWNQSMPAPVFTSLQNNMKAGANGIRTFTAYIANAGTPSISRQDGSWISSVTDNGVGDVTVNFAGGTFSANPNCQLTCYNTAGAGCGISAINTTPASSSLLRTIIFSTTTAAAIDRDFYISCTGPQ